VQLNLTKLAEFLEQNSEDQRLTRINMLKTVLRIIKLLIFYDNNKNMKGFNFSLSSLENSDNPRVNKDHIYLDKFKSKHTLLFLFLTLRVVTFKKGSFSARLKFCLGLLYFLKISDYILEAKKIGFTGFGFLFEIKSLFWILRENGYYTVYFEPRYILNKKSCVVCDEVVLPSSHGVEYAQENKIYGNAKVRCSKVISPLRQASYSKKKSILFYSCGLYARSPDFYNKEYLTKYTDLENNLIKRLSLYSKSRAIRVFISPHYFRGIETFEMAYAHYSSFHGNFEILKADNILLREDQVGISFGSNALLKQIDENSTAYIVEGFAEQRSFFNHPSLIDYYVNFQMLDDKLDSCF
jgi:hypothetical protein